MSRSKKAGILNIIVFILVVIATIWMFSGLKTGPLVENNFSMLKFFTIDSNILMGLIALIVGINELKKENISKFMYILKLVGTVQVTITMLVTVLYLTPTTINQYGLFGMYYKSNLLFHLIVPILSILVFVLYERSNLIKKKDTLYSLIPISMYAIYYVYETLSHTSKGIVQKGYDWYGFFVFGTKSVIIVLPLILIFSYIISCVLWKLNGKDK